MRRTELSTRIQQCRASLGRMVPLRVHGKVADISGLIVDLDGLNGYVSVGDRLALNGRGQPPVEAEIVGFRGAFTQAMPFGRLDGLGPGHDAAVLGPCGDTLAVCGGWLGRVIDPLIRPIDGKGAVPIGARRRKLRAEPPDATARVRLGPRLNLGIRSLDCFTTCRQGQRLGLFAGSGIGKSTMLAMLMRNAQCDVVVLALVGERGREVREFLEDDLGRMTSARPACAAPSSSSQPRMRRQAAYTAMTIAEHFRDEGKSVLLMMDSVTRFCLALREIGLSVGEPPANRRRPEATHRACLRNCRVCWSGRALEPNSRTVPPAKSRPCSPCWSRVTITMSRSPMRCGGSWTAT
jgi:flagellum-specific ATP synthase